MLKKNWISITICIVVILILLIKSDSKSSINDDVSFKIADSTLITKIFLADRNGNTITLRKNKDQWIVNEKHLVRNDAIATLLSTSSKISIKKPVSKNAFENVIKFMSTTAVYVEFFEDENLVKAYWIGSNTPDHLATYMLLKGSEIPFAVYIPSFNGFLSPRYGIQGNTLSLASWRSNTIFNISAKDINSIKYTNFLNQDSSYTLKINPFKLTNSKNISVSFNKNKVMKLINSFKNLNCEIFKEEKSKIDYSQQIEELVVNSDTLRTYKISEKDKKDKKNNFTVNRKYATLNNGDLMLIQGYVFNKVLINITELTK
jgi:hypothetical protein